MAVRRNCPPGADDGRAIWMKNLVKEEMKMPEKIINVLENIAAVKGQDYVEGLVDMANILAPKVKPDTDRDAY